MAEMDDWRCRVVFVEEMNIIGLCRYAHGELAGLRGSQRPSLIDEIDQGEKGYCESVKKQSMQGTCAYAGEVITRKRISMGAESWV